MKGLFAINLLFVFFIISCNFDVDEISTKPNTNDIENLVVDGAIILGKKLVNPYSVENMKKAYNELQNEGLMKSTINIEATHLYVRFLPKNGDEFEMLKQDKTLTLFSYPLDCELTEGETYIDTSVSGDFTWLYTKVPIGFVSPVDGYEIIEELYLPLDSEFAEQGLKSQVTDSSFIELWEALEERSLKLTGNYIKNNIADNILKSTWTPNCTIKVKDDITGSFIPLQGVTVRARWWFNWEDGLTNSLGYAKMSGSFSGKVNWSIVWEGRDWDIREGNYGQAYYNGPSNSTSNWELNIDKGGLSFVYAHVHRSCFAYWHNSLNLKTPFTYNIWQQKVKIGVHNEADRAFMNWGLRWALASMVNIYRYNSSGNEKNCASIMLTVNHELGHVSHWDMNSSDFTYGDDKVVESWAVGVAYVLTTQFYSSSIIDHGNWQNLKFSDLTGHYENKYTPLVIDLIDNYNQRAVYGGSLLYPIDRVNGYTISQIESSLMGARSLQQWRDNLNNEHSNSTKIYLDELFDNYINMQ